MSTTPRTDAAPKAAYRDAMFCELVSADFARQLETELAEARAEVSRLKDELESHAWEISPAMAQAKIEQLNAEVERLREDKARLDWLEAHADRSLETMLYNGKRAFWIRGAHDTEDAIRAAIDAARKQTP